MFNVGGPEIMVVLLVALVVLGPEQLPKAMRTFGNVMAQVRKVSNGFQDEMRNAMNTLEASPSGSSGAASDRSTAGAGSGSTVTETVARNDAAGAPPVPGEANADPVADRPPSSPDGPLAGRSGPSAADRAAG